jgi:hypothetical protein
MKNFCIPFDDSVDFSQSEKELDNFFQACVKQIVNSKKKTEFNEIKSENAPIWGYRAELFPQVLVNALMTKALQEAMTRSKSFRKFIDLVIAKHGWCKNSNSTIDHMSLLEGTAHFESDNEHPDTKEISHIHYDLRIYYGKNVLKNKTDERKIEEYSLHFNHGITYLRDPKQGIGGMWTSRFLCIYDLPFKAQGEIWYTATKLMTVPTLFHYFINKYKNEKELFEESGLIKTSYAE